MSDNPSLFRRFRSHLIIETALILALLVYVLSGKDHGVGVGVGVSDTVVGVGLMVLLSQWTLYTAQDVLRLVVARRRRISG
ncbi:MAG: hypothetical protein R3175_08330 [Marinobacter sp.]|uniref:hypothetical protein n=1 Tax=Marinobacter sp. TaxID=50741 RepID=UPI00299D903D|nr:hypothetical protein [Marinobacter sp.]MDX1756048.1 hypothetical protein [Marinobacter sp.]